MTKTRENKWYQTRYQPISPWFFGQPYMTHYMIECEQNE